MVKPLKRCRAVILTCWYRVAYWLGHWRLGCSPVGRVMIFARTYRDFLYQRVFLNLLEVIPRLFWALGSKPDLVVAPLRDPQVIFSQKPEITVEGIAKQYVRIYEKGKQ